MFKFEKYLLSRIPVGFSNGLRNIKILCEVLGSPQKSFESIHIAGTNGKGSTAFYLANILQAHGASTGLFTSPHLVSVRERIRINGKMISQSELNDVISQVERAAKVAKIEPSYFETLTAAAFLWFKQNNILVAVLEAGLGGRLDSTRIARGKFAAITSIGLDHTELLGDTEEEILKEKLGIVKKNAILVLGDLPRALLAQCPPYEKAKKISPELQVGNFGKIYVKNAEIAWTVAQEFLDSTFNEKKARAVLKNAVWPGRMQMLKNFILDGAHNPDAAEILAQCLEEKKLGPLPCIFASLTDKDTEGVLRALKPHISVCHPVQVENPRARSVEEILEICEKLKIKTTTENFKNKTPILVTGSLYIVGKVIAELCGEAVDLTEF
ncbi:MAG: Mur ligase family protein [Fibromonadales bacterium]|nr:Mur ligase family protein [Fibromonadales bacterium]